MTHFPGRETTDDESRSGAARLEPAYPVVGWVVFAGIFFRTEWLHGFRNLLGNDGDTRLIAFICEHWFALLHGHGAGGGWRDMPFFYPVKGLVGWSDAFVLFEPFYIPLREIGCGPVLALAVTLIIFSFIGFVCFYYLVRAWFPSHPLILVAGCAVFCFANSLYLHSSSYQLFGIYLLPPIVLIARRAITAPPRRGALLGAVAGLLFGLFIFTTYYVAVFALIALAFVVVWTLLLRRRAVLSWPRPSLAVVAATAVAFVVGAVPAAVTYLPARSSLTGPTQQLVTGYSIGWRSIVNVGVGNGLWSHLEARISGSKTLSVYEGSYGMTPVLFAALLVGGGWLVWRLSRRRPDRTGTAWAGLVLTLSALSLAFLPVRFGSKPPWLLLRVLPGLNAIRAIDRIQVVSGSLAVMALLAVASELWNEPSSRQLLVRLAVAVVATVIVAEQYNHYGVTQVNRNKQDQLLASIRPAPASCRYFFVIDSKNPGLPFYEAQIDAMFVAQAVGVPTINGYTGYNPNGWHMEEIGDPNYLAGVAVWENQEHLGAGACELDLAGMAWAPA